MKQRVQPTFRPCHSCHRALRQGLVPLVLAFLLGCGRPQMPDASPAGRPSAPTSPPGPQAAVPAAPMPAPAAPVRSTVPVPTPPKPVAGQAELTLARQMDDAHGSGSAPFKAALRRAAPHLPVLSAATGMEPLTWTPVTLPAVPGAGKDDRDRPFGAFRFQSPLAGPADLYWAFGCDEPHIEWYIVPDRGTMEGFDDYQRDWRVDIPGVDLPRDNKLVLQELVGGQILPERDYIIWMAAPQGRPALEVQCALRLVPAGTFPSDHRAEMLARRLDLKYGFTQFPETPEGLQEAGKTLSDLHDSDGTSVAVMRRMLQPLLRQIPAADIKTSGSARWTRVTPSGPKFATLRFRSPLDVPARLCAAYVVSEEQLQWGLIPPKEAPTESFDVSLEVDCPLPGTANPDENLAMFASLPDDLIHPGEDYLLWFTPSRGILADFDITLRLVPESQTPLPSSAPHIAETLGLSIPDRPTPERIAAALRRCQNLIQEKQQKTRSFARLLDFVGPWLPPLVDSEGDAPSPWRTIAPGAEEPQFTAFRVDLKERSQVVCALACPLKEDLRWGFFDSTGIWSNAVSKEMVRHDVRLEGVALPGQNTLLLETGVSEVPEGSTRQRLVFFVSGFKDEPLKAWLKSAVFPLPSGEPAWDFAETSRHVGVRLERAVPFGRRLAAVESSITGTSFLNAREILTSGADGRLSVHESDSGELLRQSVMDDDAASRRRVSAMRIETVRREDKRIVTREDGLSVVYDHDLKRTGYLPWPATDSHRDVAFLDGGRRVVGFHGIPNSNYGQVLHLWDLQDESVDATRDFGPRGYLIDLASGGKPEQLVASLFDDRIREIGAVRDRKVRYAGRISFLDPKTLEETRTISGGIWNFCSLSEDGSRLFGIQTEGLIGCWKVPGETPLATIAGLELVRAFSASDDGRVLATMTASGAIQVWDVDRARLLRWWTPEGALPTSLGLSPDGRRLAIGSDDQQLWIADIPAPHDGSNPDADLSAMTDSIGMRLVRIPAGQFRMGSLPSTRYKHYRVITQPNQLPERGVTMSRPFRIGACEVTVGQFRKFVDATGYQTTAESSGRGGKHTFPGSTQPRTDPSLNWKNPGFDQEEDHPVVQVSHVDAVAFCEWLSKVEGVKYRLPTEAEWEYSARGGTDTLSPTGDLTELFDRMVNIADAKYREVNPAADWANRWDDGFGYTSPAGHLFPNGFGLHDMLGNVWEMCSDYYDPAYYTYGPAVDPPGPPSGKTHTVRGSSYSYNPTMTYCAFRDHDEPTYVSSFVGFRVVREIP